MTKTTRGSTANGLRTGEWRTLSAARGAGRLRGGLFGLVGIAAAAVAGPALAQSQPGSGPLQGAWLEQSLNCDDVFVFKGGKPAFRKPVNVFSPALLITGKRLVTPQASCTLGSLSQAGDRHEMTLNCANSIADQTVKAYFSLRSDGVLVRYLDDKDTFGSRYMQCKPH